MVVQERWTMEANFDRGPRHFFQAVPAPLRPLAVAMVKRKVRQNLHAHGMGRYSPEERLELARQAVGAIAAILGERGYLMRDEPCWADATVGAFMVAGLSPVFESPLRGVIEGHPNLVAYAGRIRERYFPETH
jgi:glutathione S-transferase